MRPRSTRSSAAEHVRPTSAEGVEDRRQGRETGHCEATSIRQARSTRPDAAVESKRAIQVQTVTKRSRQEALQDGEPDHREPPFRGNINMQLAVRQDAGNESSLMAESEELEAKERPARTPEGRKQLELALAPARQRRTTAPSVDPRVPTSPFWPRDRERRRSPPRDTMPSTYGTRHRMRQVNAYKCVHSRSAEC